MACYSMIKFDVRQVRIENIALFKAALDMHGFTYRENGDVIRFEGSLEGQYLRGELNTKKGELSMTKVEHADTIKRIYAAGVLKEGVRRFGWTETREAEGTTLLKRRFQ